MAFYKATIKTKRPWDGYVEKETKTIIELPDKMNCVNAFTLILRAFRKQGHFRGFRQTMFMGLTRFGGRDGYGWSTRTKLLGDHGFRYMEFELNKIEI